jgi:hypothetical protein
VNTPSKPPGYRSRTAATIAGRAWPTRPRTVRSPHQGALGQRPNGSGPTRIRLRHSRSIRDAGVADQRVQVPTGLSKESAIWASVRVSACLPRFRPHKHGSEPST